MEENKEVDIYAKEYDESGLINKLTKYAKSAGSEVVEKVLWLYFTLQKDEVPMKVKATIIGALGYFIFPLDAIPDLAPLIGYSDDLGVITMAIATVSMYIDQDVKEKAKKKMHDWFN